MTWSPSWSRSGWRSAWTTTSAAACIRSAAFDIRIWRTHSQPHAIEARGRAYGDRRRRRAVYRRDDGPQSVELRSAAVAGGGDPQAAGDLGTSSHPGVLYRQLSQ